MTADRNHVRTRGDRIRAGPRRSVAPLTNCVEVMREIHAAQPVSLGKRAPAPNAPPALEFHRLRVTVELLDREQFSNPQTSIRTPVWRATAMAYRSRAS